MAKKGGAVGGMNPYQMSSSAMQGSAGAFNTAGQMYGSGGYDPSQSNAALAQAMGLFSNPNVGRVGTHIVDPRGLHTTAAGYGAVNSGYQGYGALGVGSQGYGAAQQINAPMIAGQMGKYYNPYTSEVINAATRDIDRSRRMQMNDVGAAASSAGAFGGSRHGLVEAETNRAAQETIADTSANLRNQMFNTAAGLGAQDVSNILGVRSANQAATNRAREFGAGASNVARLATQAAHNRAREFGASAGNVARLSNQAAQNRALEFNAANRQNTGQFNANLMSGLRTFNAGQRSIANQQNAAAQMARAGGLMDAAGGFQANEQAAASDWLARAAGMMGVGGAAAGLGQQAYGIGSDIGQRQLEQGTMSQALRQMLLDSAGGMFSQYTGQPQNLLNLRLASVGANPLANAGTTTQTTRQPMDWFGLFGNLAKAGATAYAGSDISLKENVAPTGATTPSGVPLYHFHYIGSKTPRIGVIAQELEKTQPDAVVTIGGVKLVDYSRVH